MGVTKEYIVLDVRRYCVSWIVLGACISFGVYYLRVYPPYLEYWQLPSYYVSALLMKTTVVLWTYMNTSLRKSARDLNKCFKVSYYCVRHSTSRHILLCTAQYFQAHIVVYSTVLPGTYCCVQHSTSRHILLCTAQYFQAHIVVYSTVLPGTYCCVQHSTSTHIF